MQAMRKAHIARELGVTAGRVSQYITQGMPVLPDGKIDLDAARRWVASNLDPTRRVLHHAAKSGTRKYNPKNGAPPGFSVLDEMENPVDKAIVMAGLTTLYTLRSDVAHMAAEAGADCKVAHATANFVFGLTMERMLRFWRDAGIKYFDDVDVSFFELEYMTEPDWAEIAAIAGEAVDRKAWEAHQKTRRMSQ